MTAFDVAELNSSAGLDVTPPGRGSGAPSGTLASGTSQTTLSLITNENATCRFATTAGTAYAAMVNVFTTNGGTFDGRFIYFAPTNNGSGPHGEALLYDTTQPFTSVASWLTYDPGAHAIGTDPDGFAGTIFDQRYVYFVPDRNEPGVPSGEVLRYDTGAILQTTTVARLTVHAAPRTSTPLPLVNAWSVAAIVGNSVNTLVTLTNPTDAFVDVSCLSM